MTAPLRTRRPTAAPPEVADRVYRLGTRWINFHLVEDEGEFTLVDAGYPGYWKHLDGAIEALGTTLGSIRAVIVTHHHADHAGTAERLRSSAGARVFVGEADAWIVAGKYPSHASPGFYRRCTWHRSGLGFLAHSAAAGGAKYRPVQDIEVMREDRTLDLPGRPHVIHTPGHTAGHYSVALRDRGVLLSGDAMATFDYVTGRRGIGLHPLNDDREIALSSLDRLDQVDAETVVVAHGDPWTQGLRRAIEIIRGAPESMTRG
ncbi:MAG TPA: MBL fold metallo-hydrolase [Solirubrobacterales bacterium]|jgi:glyoxylase-like metal-dependent hydrolase (beta-lactamase superfamily II)